MSGSHRTRQSSACGGAGTREEGICTEGWNNYVSGWREHPCRTAAYVLHMCCRRYLCEQVSHHPPVSAYHAHGGGPSGKPWEVQVGEGVLLWRSLRVLIRGEGGSTSRWRQRNYFHTYTLCFVQGEFEIKTKFWGKSIELILLGCESLKLHGHDEEYRWVRVNSVEGVHLGVDDSGVPVATTAGMICQPRSVPSPCSSLLITLQVEPRHHLRA